MDPDDQPRTVFFVRTRAQRARYPDSEPLFLIDLALMHRYGDVCRLKVVDPPRDAGLAAPLSGATPVRVIDVCETALYPRARRAVIVDDRRTPEQ